MKSPAADVTSVQMDWLKQWSLFSPEAVAFKDAETGVEFTYAALYYLSCRLASHIAERFDVRRGDRVAVLATNEMEYIALFFAIQRIGAMMVPVNFRLTATEITHILSDSEPALLIHQEQFTSVLEQVDAKHGPEKRWAFDGKSEESLVSWVARELASFHAMSSARRASAPAWSVPFAGEFESPCMILYTSGTTGQPKGAIVNNRMLHWNSLNTSLRLSLSENDATLSFLPFFHTGGWNVLLTPFVHRGARTVVMRKFDPDVVMRLCDEEKVTILFGVPTTMEMMSRTEGFKTRDLSSVRYAIVGGEPMPLELIRTWQKRGVAIRQGYGLTEFGPSVFSLNEEDALRKIGSIGFPNFYVRTRVVDNDDRDVVPGEIGELILQGPVCTPGYWRNEAATQETIKDGWLHTGDLVRVDQEGYYYVAGRKKEMFISGGENVYPVEVEQTIGRHPAIREVAVVGVADTKWGEVGRAFVSLKPGCNLTEEELLTFCTDKLAKFKTPKSVIFLADLPKGDSGKILKRKLH